MTMSSTEAVSRDPILVRWGRYAVRRTFLPRLVRAYALLAGGAVSPIEGPDAAPVVTQARFAAALRGTVNDGLPLIAVGSTVFYMALAFIALESPELGFNPFLLCVASAAATLAFRVAWGYELIPLRWAHSALGIMMILLIGHALWRWRMFGGGQESGLVGMALITAGSLSLSLPWALSLTVGGLFVWFAITILYGMRWPDAYVSAFLVATPSVAAVVRLGRRTVIERMEQYRLRDLHQRAELRRAQRSLETKVRERTANLVAANDQLLREIAERKRMEKELEQARSGLELRVVERTAELSSLNEALHREMAERLRAEEQMQHHREELAHTLRVHTVGQMMGSLAHELNQPLMAIANNIEACASYIESGDVDRAKLHDLLQHATSEVLRAGSIVHHLRAFLEKREPQVERSDLCQLTKDVANLLEPGMRDNGVALRIESHSETLPVFGNRIQIEQVILNLARNAIDSMQQDGGQAAELRIVLRATTHDTAEIAVIDNGPGVRDPDWQRIFEPFFTTKRSGLGLGLAISRSIVEAHHGRLWLEPRADGHAGVVAKFELPIRKGGE
jgi:signal transduction histidine kinase